MIPPNDELPRDDVGPKASVEGDGEVVSGLFRAATEEEFCALLRWIKHSSGLTAGQIAAKAKLPRSTAYHFVSHRNTRLPKDVKQLAAFLRACNLPATQAAEVMRIWGELRSRRDTEKSDALVELDETDQDHEAVALERLRTMRIDAAFFGVRDQTRGSRRLYSSRSRPAWAELLTMVLSSWQRTARAVLLLLAAAACLGVLVLVFVRDGAVGPAMLAGIVAIMFVAERAMRRRDRDEP